MTSALTRVTQNIREGRGALSMQQYADFFDFNNLSYPFMLHQTMQGNYEDAVQDTSFEALAVSAMKQNGIVFACMQARLKLFSEAKFKFRNLNGQDGLPGKLFGSKELLPLERPWPNGVTADLLARAIQDVDLGGNFFGARRVVRTGPNPGVRIRRLRPDYVTLVYGSFEDANVEMGDIDAELLGMIYHPGGISSNGRPPLFLQTSEFMHWAPLPDPLAMGRGMSWVVPIIREYLGDTAMIQHKNRFLEGGATPNLVVSLDPSIKKEAFAEWVKMFSDKHEGVANAYKTLYLGAGANIIPVGKDFKQMEFAITQAVGEVRICAAAAVPPVLVGVTEGIRAATYSNYQSAKRYFGDSTLRPLWRNFAASAESIINVPDGSQLWYDDHDIPFLYDDAKDAAAIQARKAATIKSLVDSGYEANSVIKAVIADDFNQLKHTGLFSVQLLPPGHALVPNVPTQMPMPKPANPDKTDGTAQPKAPDKPAKVTKPSGPEKKSDEEDSEERYVPTISPDVMDLLMAVATERAALQQERIALAQEHARMVSARDVTPPDPVQVHIHEGAIRGGDVHVDAQSHINEGAIRSEVKVAAPAPTPPPNVDFRLENGAIVVESPDVVFQEGAIRGGDISVAPAETRFEPGSIVVDAQTHIEEGAIRSETHVDVPDFELRDGVIHVINNMPEITMPDVKVEVPVTVEGREASPPAINVDARTTIEPGAVQVDAPVTVERSEVHVATPDVNVNVERQDISVTTPDVRVDAPITVEGSQITVETPDVVVAEGAVKVDVDARTTVEEGAVRADLTVEPTEVTFERGAVQVDAQTHIEPGAVQVDVPVTVEPTEVNVEQPEIHVDARTSIEEGALRVEPAQVNIEPSKVYVDAPITVERTVVEVDSPVTIERGAVSVELPEERRTKTVRTSKFDIDGEGKIVGKTETEEEVEVEDEPEPEPEAEPEVTEEPAGE